MEPSKSHNFSGKTILSVVVPVTRMAGKLQNLQTWLNEAKFYPIQVILVHDVQDEHTGNALRALINETKDLNVQLIEGIYNSPGLARNDGIPQATGEWVAFWDADDIPNLKECFAVISAARPDSFVLISRFRTVSLESQKMLWESPSFSNKNKMATVSEFPGIWRMVFRAQIISKIRFREFCMAEDQFFLIEHSLLQGSIQFSEEVIYSYYTGVPGQLTSQADKLSELPEVILEIAKLKKQPWFQIDLRLTARIILTSLLKGNHHTKILTFKLMPKVMKSFGLKNSIKMGVFQTVQIFSLLVIFILLGSRKLADAVKNKA